jgi:hypothetical protein
MASGFGRAPTVMSFLTAARPCRSGCLLRSPLWRGGNRRCCFRGVLVIGLAGRLRARWQRRQAVIAVIRQARGRTVIVRQRGWRSGDADRGRLRFGRLG